MAGVSSQAVRAGRAFVELFTKNEGMYKGLDQAKKKFQAWGQSLMKSGAIAGAAGASVAAPLLALFQKAAERGADAQTLARRFGTTTDAVQELQYAFEKGGVSADEFGGFLDGLAGKISAAANSNEELIQGMRGLNGRALIGMSLPAQIDLIFDKLASIVSEQDRVAEANKLGLGGMLPYLKDGAAGLAAFKREAHDVGAVLSAEDAKTGFQVMKEWNRVMREGQYTLLAFGQALLPQAEGVGTLGDRVSGLLKSTREWVANNRGLIVTVAAVGLGLAAAGAAVTALGAASWVTASAIGAVNVALGVLLSPLGLTALAVGGLTALFLTQTDVGRSWAAAMGVHLETTKANAVEAFGAIGQAIAGGDIQAAWKIATTFIELEWTRLWNAAQGVALDFVNFVADGWDSLKYIVADASADMGQTFATLFIQGVRAAFLEFEGLTRRAMRAAAALVGAFDGDMARNLNLLADAPRDLLLGAIKAAQATADADAAAAKKAAQDELDRARSVRAGATGIVKAQLDAEVAAAQAKLDALTAAQKGKGAGGGAEAEKLRGAIGSLPAAVKGIFSGPVQMQLNYADQTAKRQLDAAVSTAASTKVLPDIDKKIGAVADALKFGR